MTLDIALTILFIFGVVGLFVFAGRRSRIPAEPLKTRWVNWVVVQLIAVLIGLLLVVRLMSIFGLTSPP